VIRYTRTTELDVTEANVKSATDDGSTAIRIPDLTAVLNLR